MKPESSPFHKPTPPKGYPEGAPANVAMELAEEFVQASLEFDAAQERLKVAKSKLGFLLMEECEKTMRRGHPQEVVRLPVSGVELKAIQMARMRSLPIEIRDQMVEALGGTESFDDFIVERSVLQMDDTLTFADMTKAIGLGGATKLLNEARRIGKPFKTRQSLELRADFRLRLMGIVDDGPRKDALFNLFRWAVAEPHISVQKKR